MGEGRQGDVHADQLSALVGVLGDSFRALDLQLQFLAHLDKFALHVLVLHGQVLDAVVFNVGLLHDVALLAADDSELAGCLMLSIVFLEHLRRLAAEVCAFDL